VKAYAGIGTVRTLTRGVNSRFRNSICVKSASADPTNLNDKTPYNPYFAADGHTVPNRIEVDFVEVKRA
jgi:hypothetical protein